LHELGKVDHKNGRWCLVLLKRRGGLFGLHHKRV
jgi:hypothetical protein